MGQFHPRPFVRASLALLVALGSSIAFPKDGVNAHDGSSELLAPPVVQLGERAANGSNSFAIVWQSTDTDHPFKVRMSQDALHKFAKITYRTVKGAGIEPHRIYTAEFRGYEPGVPLLYEIVDGDAVLFHATINPPKSDEQAYKFAVFGESGCGSPVEPQISYQVYQQKPDLVLLTGEMSYPDGRAPSDRNDLWPYYTASVASPENGAPLFSSALVVANPGSQDDVNRNLDISGGKLGLLLRLEPAAQWSCITRGGRRARPSSTVRR